MMIHDISTAIHPDMVLWPGSSGFARSFDMCLERGDEVTNSTIHLDAHAGTHIDAPAHFISSGATVDEVDLTATVGPADVVDMRGLARISAQDVRDRVPAGATRVLLKTDNAGLGPGFDPEFVALTPDGAEELATRGVRLVGNDYLSIQPFGGDPRSHTILLENKVVVLEGLSLSKVSPGRYVLICLPLLLRDLEAAPARAVLLEGAMS